MCACVREEVNRVTCFNGIRHLKVVPQRSNGSSADEGSGSQRPDCIEDGIAIVFGIIERLCENKCKRVTEGRVLQLLCFGSCDCNEKGSVAHSLRQLRKLVWCKVFVVLHDDDDDERRKSLAKLKQKRNPKCQEDAIYMLGSLHT